MKNLSKRRYFVFIFLLIGLSSFTVLFFNIPQTNAQTTLIIWYTGDETVDDTFLSLIDDYEVQNGITINAIHKDSETFPLDYKVAHSTGTPDLIQGDAEWIANLVHSESLMPIPEENFNEEYIKEALRSVSFYLREDGSYSFDSLVKFGFPLVVDTLAFIYNKDNQSNAVIPETTGSWTTAEFKTAITRMNDQSLPDSEQYGISYINFLDTGEALFLGAGGKMFNDYTLDQAHIAVNSNESVDALTFIYELGACSGCFELTPSYPDDYSISNLVDLIDGKDLVYEDFSVSGNVSSTMLYAYQLKNLSSSGIFSDETKLGIAPSPMDENGQPPFLEVAALMINSKSPNKEESLEFAKFLSSKSSMVQMANSENLLPAIVSAYDDSTLSDNSIIQKYKPLVMQGSSKPLSRYWLQVEKIFGEKIFETMVGTRDGEYTATALEIFWKFDLLQNADTPGIGPDIDEGGVIPGAPTLAILSVLAIAVITIVTRKKPWRYLK